MTCHDLRGGDSGSGGNALFVVLASDGLFDVMSNEEVAQFVTRSVQHSTAQHSTSQPVHRIAVLAACRSACCTESLSENR